MLALSFRRQSQWSTDGFPSLEWRQKVHGICCSEEQSVECENWELAFLFPQRVPDEGLSVTRFSNGKRCKIQILSSLKKLITFHSSMSAVNITCALAILMLSSLRWLNFSHSCFISLTPLCFLHCPHEWLHPQLLRIHVCISSEY